MDASPDRSNVMLRASGVTVRFGGVTALQDVSLDVARGEICGLIGPNGAGKTTLFNVISRLVATAAGEVEFRGHDLLALPPHRVAGLGIARTFQNLALWPKMTVIENVMTGAHHRARQRVATALVRWRLAAEEAELEAEAWKILGTLDLHDVAYRPCAGLPHGTLKRVELARALMGRPSLLLLDEPATGSTHGEVDELAVLIRAIREAYGLTVLLVEHHMGLVMGVCDHVVVLDLGRNLAEGPPASIQHDAGVVAAYLGGTR